MDWRLHQLNHILCTSLTVNPRHGNPYVQQSWHAQAASEQHTTSALYVAPGRTDGGSLLFADLLQHAGYLNLKHITVPEAPLLFR